MNPTPSPQKQKPNSKLKSKTFRISNMGDETKASIGAVIAALDDSLAKL